MRRSYKVANKRPKIIFQSKPNSNVLEPAPGSEQHPRQPRHAHPPTPESLKSIIPQSRGGCQTARLPTRRSSDQAFNEEENSQFTQNRQLVSGFGGQHHEMSSVPDLFTTLPPIRDQLNTATSIVQDRTIQDCLPLLAVAGSPNQRETRNASGLPKLARQEHIEYLHDSLRDLPAGFVGFDASRSWILYWALTGLSLLGEDVGIYRDRVVQTLAPMQNADGGFGGGHGQISHLAPSYAAVLSLAIVGESKALDLIDRRSMWKWLGEMKQLNGGFSLCQGGEIDVRGAYCALIIIALLDLPPGLPFSSPVRKNGMQSFLDKLPEWISRCQTFEGGISGAPDTEAHGAYAFLALACLCIIGPPDITIRKHLDLPQLISWSSARQHAPEGGFAGRTNKLVDTCYSHWVGGCWPFIEEAIRLENVRSHQMSGSRVSLYHREGLIRYIMCCSQDEEGGFRDKPNKHVDGYHTCYSLAGLSSAQHRQRFIRVDWSESVMGLEAAFCWETSDDNPLIRNEHGEVFYSVEDEVEPIHPIFAISYEAVERTRLWYGEKAGF